LLYHSIRLLQSSASLMGVAVLVVGIQHGMVHLNPLLADVDIEPTLSTIRQ
jgi:hypothetical protein